MYKGFTLIELLIVVAIIGILAAIGVAVIPGLLGNTKVKACLSNHDSISKYVSISLVLCSSGNSTINFVDTNGKPNTISCNLTNDSIATQFMSNFEGQKYMSAFEPTRPQVESGDNPQTGKTTIFGMSPQTGSSTKTITVSSCCDNKFDTGNSCQANKTLIMKTFDCDSCK